MFELHFKGVQIPVIFEEDTDLEVVYLRLVFKNSGKIYERHLGLAKMFARLLNEGSDDKFFQKIETKAINLSSSSTLECFEINISCLKEHFAFAMKELKILLSKPRFDEKILQKLKNIALSELASKNSDYDFLAKTLLNKISFKAKEFETSSDGDEKSISKITLSMLENFYKEHLSLNNLYISLGGKITKDEFCTLIEPCLEPLSKKEGLKDKHFKQSIICEDEICVKKESEQAYIYFASPFHADFKDKKLYLAKLAFFILGAGGFGSRLMEEIRVKRGLAYSAYAILDMNRSYARCFGYLQTKNENAKNAKKLIKELFNDFVKKGVSESEFEAAKKFLIGSTPLRYESLEKRLNIAFSEYYNELGLGYFKKELTHIKNADLKELNHYIKSHEELVKLSFASIQNEN
ncbi:insulinase family protein [Campylobacter sp. MIT 99-7217]|uniref:M16 family metallopeptidase n=1 Tax=Campylobacter sp. MIT 99-7217 TaxID=535091 RepID=UPI00115928D6|nr:pitrilysin family protein [Campylobacter sp. MIT 99-7217]TQR34452.1 insulinase family protein [Campylobacter sp. MIT 99-7217]